MTAARVAEVVFPIPIDKVFHYTLPSEAEPGSASPGVRVQAPFGKSSKTGLLVGYAEGGSSPALPLKPLQAFLDSKPVLDSASLELARWIRRRYACSLGEAAFSLLAPGWRKPGRKPRADSGPAPEPAAAPPEPFVLTPEQTAAGSEIGRAVERREGGIFLVWGVAAAGKTEIYMGAIERTLERGGGVLYLVPEINLTAQVFPELERRFPGKAVLWHSGIKESARRAAYQALREGTKRIVLGARSAVTAPVPDLALVVVDEEHDALYKEDSKPRVHARALALERARLSRAVAVLGSATPSLESFREAREGRYRWIEVRQRVAGPAPNISIVDMRRYSREIVLSDTLKAAVAERLRRREQTILFLNRRGFYTFCRCPKCGWVLRCPSCGVPAVLHGGSAKPKKVKADLKKGAPEDAKGGGGVLRCHYCIFRTKPPEKCGECGHEALWMGGLGTERLNSVLEKDFPWAKIVRWDTDVARTHEAHEAVLRSVIKEGTDIIVGTKIVSQGLDLPGVTLVGIVDADTALHRPDFRAGERTFQMLVQAAGRSGRRDVQGEVIIQTRLPEHPALRFAATMDYPAFAEAEMKDREELGYPPCGRLAQLIFTGRKEATAVEEASAFVKWLGENGPHPGAQALGPAPATHARRAGKARVQVLLKGAEGAFEQTIEALRGYRPGKGVRLLVDIDPEELR